MVVNDVDGRSELVRATTAAPAFVLVIIDIIVIVVVVGVVVVVVQVDLTVTAHAREVDVVIGGVALAGIRLGDGRVRVVKMVVHSRGPRLVH